jgi:hypothetical protein
MSDHPVSSDPLGDLPDDQRITALFANLVMQQTNLALMFLGHVPHPESGKTVTDLDAAQMFIGCLEMLEAKTQGNLSAEEKGLLKQSLTAVRMAFVQAVEHPASPEAASQPAAAPSSAAPATAPAAAPEQSAPGTGASATEGAEAESRKKFTKKY